MGVIRFVRKHIICSVIDVLLSRGEDSCWVWIGLFTVASAYDLIEVLGTGGGVERDLFDIVER